MSQAPRRRRAALAAAAVAAALAAQPAGAQAAVERVETPIASTSPQADVVASAVRLKVPMMAGAAAHPEACDWISYERWRPAESSGVPTDADAVAVLMPGVVEGASAFDPLARNAIREARKRGKSIEVWGIDRRSNCLEDKTGLEYLESTGDIDGGLDYYYRGKLIGGKKFAGFAANERVAADIGLAQTILDYHAVLTNELPSQPWRESHVICGGHSLGGPLTEIYASWDFDGNKATTQDAGYRQCAGFAGFDTTLNGGIPQGAAGANKNDLLGQFTAGLLRSASGVSLAGLKAGVVPRTVNLFGISAETMNMLEGLATRADVDPGQEMTPYISRLPRTPGLEAFIKLAGSPDLLSWVNGTGSLRHLRYSAMALLGQVMDDNGGVYGLVRSSFGYFDGAPVRRNLLPNQVSGIPGLSMLVMEGPLVLPQRQSRQALTTWRNYDELPAGAKGVTDAAKEITDARDFARLTHEGPFNLTENYFPIRLILELGWLSQGDRSATLRGSLHGSKTSTKPRKVAIAGDGVTQPSMRKSDPNVILPGYNHLDVLTAAERQNDGRPEGSSQLLADVVDQALAAAR